MDGKFSFFYSVIVAFAIGLAVLGFLVWHSYKKQSYWKKKDIPSVKPFPILGSLIDNLKFPSHEVDLKRYKELGPIYGHYECNRPLLSVADTKLMRDILVKDFHVFMSKKTFCFGDGIIKRSLVNLEGQDWKRVRTIITPAFTTGKLKRVLNICKDCTQTLIQNFKTSAKAGEPVNVKKMYRALVLDVLASSAFSTKIDSHNAPGNKFVQMVREGYGKNIHWRFFLMNLSPSFMKFFRISFISQKAINFFRDFTAQIIQERENTGQKSQDFLQLLIDAVEKERAEEKIDKTDNLDIHSDFRNKNLSMDELVAQCVTFFVAGNNLLANAMSCISFLLATNEDVQEKAREEIIKCLLESNGEINYEALQEMKYLDNVISESLRLYPGKYRHERKTVSDYQLGNTGIVIPKNMIVTIPFYALHKDPQYFPEPEKFNPDRFTAKEWAKTDPYAYMPFGVGPRRCVAMRFALLEMKVCLVHVLSHFRIKTCPETKVPLEYGIGVNNIHLKDIFLKMEPRDDCPLRL